MFVSTSDTNLTVLNKLRSCQHIFIYTSIHMRLESSNIGHDIDEDIVTV